MGIFRTVSFLAFALLTFVARSEGRQIVPDSLADNGRQSTVCNDGVNGIHSFSIPADSPNGPITLMHVQYDSSRALPVSTTTYHDSMNKDQVVTRNDNFRAWDCPQLPVPEVQPDCTTTFTMTPEQQQISGQTRYDRGHMTPVNPYRFSRSAMDNTFFCVNNAPQEPLTNQGPWNVIEQTVYGGTAAGYVMTGLCNDDAPEGVTLAEVKVPGCFWKLVCSKVGSNTEVVGFIGENSLYDKNNQTAKDIRTRETKEPRSQAEVFARSGAEELILKAWTDAAQVLLENREANLAPSAQDCIGQLTLTQEIRDRWTGLVKLAQDIEDALL